MKDENLFENSGNQPRLSSTRKMKSGTQSKERVILDSNRRRLKPQLVEAGSKIGGHFSEKRMMETSLRKRESIVTERCFNLMQNQNQSEDGCGNAAKSAAWFWEE